ncbi:TerB family tellurite resistance protein [Rubripirellula lacrimiformis]|uniref:TerB family tellurite resistance protein n=1 Tax=Rubripirellula lacrimiformis TaxID=1930273 RepID=UPI001FEA072D|nr:TerB family tellurite resistance protein [Rubripirellula lacrimiformis]
MPQTFRLRARRPWLTLYFIPTVPIGGPELFVQCDQCKQTWDPTVMQMDQATHEMAAAEQFVDETIRSAVVVTLIDGSISEAEIAALLDLGSDRLGREFDREELGRLCSIAQQNGIKAANYVLTVSTRWDQGQRVEALQAMFLAASAEGELSDEKLKVLAEMREILNLSDNEYEAAIEATLR